MGLRRLAHRLRCSFVYKTGDAGRWACPEKGAVQTLTAVCPHEATRCHSQEHAPLLTEAATGFQATRPGLSNAQQHPAGCQAKHVSPEVEGHPYRSICSLAGGRVESSASISIRFLPAQVPRPSPARLPAAPRPPYKPEPSRHLRLQDHLNN